MTEFLFHFRVEIEGQDISGAIDIEYDYDGAGYAFGDISCLESDPSIIRESIREQCQDQIEAAIREDYERRSERYWTARWAGELA